MTQSLRRTLAVRFAATMAAGLSGASAVILYGASLLTQRQVDQALGGGSVLVHMLQRDIVIGLCGVIILGAGAALIGAWYLAGWAVRPVSEITAQATQIEAGTLDQRIEAHAETDEYRGLVLVLNRMLERLDAAFQSQRRLTADVSHELRTPLTALQGEMEVALRSERSPREYQLVLRSALEEIGGLTTMVEDLLLITRAESHLLQPERIPTDPNTVLRDGVEQLHRQIEEKGLTVTEALDTEVPAVPLDPGLVSLLVGHLLDNAVRHTPPGGQITVRSEAVTPATRGIRLVVENSGSTIAAADLPHIFEPFYRADQARSRGTSLGLGLALVAAIARLHGGTARARNQNGSGVRFEVDLAAPAKA